MILRPDEHGVYRNPNSGNVMLPSFIREQGRTVTKAHQDAYDTETAKAINNYRNAQATMSDEARAEQEFELRAVHGKGVDIVDCITGRRFTT